MSNDLSDLETVHVIDGFMDNAEAARAAALALSYPPASEKAYFPGRNSARALRIGGMDEAVSGIIGRRLTPNAGSAHGFCRLTLADDVGRGGVHIDPNHWSGVLFLSEPPEAGASGTDFFRHLPSGTTRAPVDKSELARFGVEAFSEMWTKVITPHTHDRSKWERTRRVEAKFNRLVLFRPWMWHNAGPGFGHDLQSGRLVYLLFYDEVRAQPR